MKEWERTLGRGMIATKLDPGVKLWIIMSSAAHTREAREDY
jgi:hypothetical protein